MGEKTKKIHIDYQGFVTDWDSVALKVSTENYIKEVEKKQYHKLDIKSVAKNLVDNHVREFSSVFHTEMHGSQRRKIERVYSKNELKQLVKDNLIADYQHEEIIDAVTDYLYSAHVGV